MIHASDTQSSSTGFVVENWKKVFSVFANTARAKVAMKMATIPAAEPILSERLMRKPMNNG
ncbi:MAG: hypothetical protein ACPH2J_04610 [Akkermansiaceae bacterium]